MRIRRRDPVLAEPADDGAVTAAYLTTGPTPQAQLDLHLGTWTSAVPIPGTSSGPRADLFDDARIHWGIEAVGGVSGRSVLELGPLEAGHTTMLERAGAGEVVAVEAHQGAFQRCLVVKNLLDLRAQFLLGDFVEYLRTTDRHFDVCVASGVLYHMVDPLELLRGIAQHSDRVILWTHHWDPRIPSERPDVEARFDGTEEVEHDGFGVRLHRYGYGDGKDAATFCGGSRATSRWMERDDILRGLEHYGLTIVDIAFDDFLAPHGPAFAVAAVRDDT